jgi:S-adenosylmethionine hydrolase
MAIALLTDFGTSGYFTGAMKGSILSVDPNASIIDITHDIPAYDISAAAFALSACYEDFPLGTIFVAIVDPGVGTDRRALAVHSHGRIFVAPDNGILGGVFGQAGEFEAFQIINETYFGPRRGSTFHGRDVFAPVAAHISLGVPLAEFGPPVEDPCRFQLPLPTVSETGDLIAEVIAVDRFGNLITNLLPGDLPEHFCVRLNGHSITSRRRTFADGATNELFLIDGSSGFVEVSLRNASASKFTGARTGNKLMLLR